MSDRVGEIPDEVVDALRMALSERPTPTPSPAFDERVLRAVAARRSTWADALAAIRAFAISGATTALACACFLRLFVVADISPAAHPEHSSSGAAVSHPRLAAIDIDSAIDDPAAFRGLLGRWQAPTGSPDGPAADEDTDGPNARRDGAGPGACGAGMSCRSRPPGIGPPDPASRCACRARYG